MTRAQLPMRSSGTEKALGPVDVLVNTAFVSRQDAPEVLSLADWKLSLDLNLTGYFLCAQEAGRRMIE